MLSLAKDSLKKSQNFYLYKQSFNYVSSLSANFTQHINETENQGLSDRNVTDHSKHEIGNSKLNKRDVASKNYSQASHHEIFNSSSSAESTHYSVSNSKEVEQSTIDMLLTSFLKNSLVDKHGTLLPKTMRHLNSIHSQMFHDTFENYSKLSNSIVGEIKKFDRNKRGESPSSRVSLKEEFSMGNTRKSTVFLMESMRSPFTMRSSGFHTTAVSPLFINTVNRVSVDGKAPQKQNPVAKNENSDVDEDSNVLENEFKYTMQAGTDLKSNNEFNEHDNEFGNFGYRRKTEFLVQSNSENRISGENKGRRHTKRQNQGLYSIQKKDESEDTANPEKNVFNHEKMEKLFPDPRSALHRIYSIVSAELKDASYKPKASFEAVDIHKKLRHWQCTYKVSWPSELSFSATARTKPAAASIAALKLLHHLLINQKIKDGIPMLYDSDEIKDILNKPAVIEVKPETITEVDQLLDWYNQDIVHLLSNPETEVSEKGASEIDLVDSREDMYEGGEGLPSINDLISPSENLSDPLRGTPLKQHSSVALDKRDMDMYHNLQERNFNGQKGLPIMDYREDIISQLEDDRVLVIKGEPGCGKSTQLPQFILDHFTAKGKGTDCNIIITQPRRISAISLAKRVADERNENLGESIGYQVRLQSVLPSGPSGGVLFCSTGILLRRLQNNPCLIGCSHVILDEAHERDLNTDILIVLLNRALLKNPDLKLVIMSATINAGLFEKYFNCNTISIPGFTYPVKMHFFDDIKKLGIRGITSQDMSLTNPFINAEQIARLIQWISKTKPDGAVLCFLPGWSEIQKLKRILEDILPRKYHIILPVHSRLPYSDQSLIFNRPPEGVRKIILATNIAETSITINDVVYVVDSCAHKEVRLQHDTGRSSIDNQWVSQGNINQRKGRAGRVQPGESYHFITREKYQSLEQFPTPEIMRAELQKAVLDCKTYTSEKAAEFFAQMPEPPRISAVQLAVNELIEIGALNEEEDLTALGKRIALFPVDPRLSKAMVYSTIFQCVHPIVTLTSILSSEFEIFSDRLYDKSPIRKLKQEFEPASDHLALAWIFEQWNSYYNEHYQHAQQFCREAQLQYGRMLTLKDLRNLYAQNLSQSRMLNTYERWENLKSRMNKCANDDELVRGVLLAGLDRVLQKRDGEFKNGRFKKVKNVMLMQDGHRATLTPDSVNYNREKWPSCYLTYQRHVHSTERRTTLIRESSIVSPLTVLLFCQGQIETRNYRKNNVETKDVMLTFQGKKNVKLVCDPETAETLLHLRKTLQNVVRYYVENQGLGHPDKNIVVIESFKEKMIDLLSKMLSESSKQINTHEELSSDDEDDESL